MDYSNLLIAILTLLIGGGGGTFITWRWLAKRSKAEAEQAEASAAKELQDIYQQLIEDIKTDRNEQKSYIQELKEDRRHLREERNIQNKRQEEMEEKIRSLQSTVARNGRMVEGMRPFMCGKTNCQDRISVSLSEDGQVSKPKKRGDNYNKNENE